MTDGSADPSSSLSSCARSDAQRIREIRTMEWGCERTPTAPCNQRDGVRHPQYAELVVTEWCDGCIVSWLLQRSEEARETIEALRKEIEHAAAIAELRIDLLKADLAGAGARLRATPQEQDDALTRSGRVDVEPPPQPAATDPKV